MAVAITIRLCTFRYSYLFILSGDSETGKTWFNFWIPLYVWSSICCVI